MKRLIAESYLLLLWAEFVITFRNLDFLHQRVRDTKIRHAGSGTLASAEGLSRAMDFACVLFPKQVLCLQRSAATAILLRRHCIHAEMVIGAQLLPAKFHAWVEVGRTVVNDKPYVNELYQVLERC
jgi:hypothetical protein